MSFAINSPAFRENAAIPPKYTQDSDNVSPPLSWHGQPRGTRSLALIVDDPDAPRPTPFVHWVLYNIPCDSAGLPEAIPAEPQPIAVVGAAQGKNSSNQIGYAGPLPPRGHGTHHYIFHLYALDTLNIPDSDLDKNALLRAMSGHILAETTVIGTYER